MSTGRKIQKGWREGMGAYMKRDGYLPGDPVPGELETLLYYNQEDERTVNGDRQKEAWTKVWVPCQINIEEGPRRSPRIDWIESKREDVDRWPILQFFSDDLRPGAAPDAQMLFKCILPPHAFRPFQALLHVAQAVLGLDAFDNDEYYNDQNRLNITTLMEAAGAHRAEVLLLCRSGIEWDKYRRINTRWFGDLYSPNLCGCRVYTRDPEFMAMCRTPSAVRSMAHQFHLDHHRTAKAVSSFDVDTPPRRGEEFERSGYLNYIGD